MRDNPYFASKENTGEQLRQLVMRGYVITKTNQECCTQLYLGPKLVNTGINNLKALFSEGTATLT